MPFTDDEILKMTPEQREAAAQQLEQYLTKQQPQIKQRPQGFNLRGAALGGLRYLSGFGQGVPINETNISPRNDINTFIMKEQIRQQMKPAKEKTIQEKAFDAKQAGKPLQGFSIEETSKLAGGYISPKQKMQNEPQVATNLRKEFRSQKPIQDFNIINRSYDALESAYKLSTSPDAKSLLASDQALGVLFQKMLDPTSVVRESEYARTPEGAAFIHRIESIIPQLQKGGLRLTNEDRLAIIQQAKAMLDSSQNLARQQKSFYTGLAKSYKVNPAMVTGGFPIVPKNLPIPQQSVQQQIQEDQTNDLTEENIQHTMQKYGVSREDVLKRIQGR